MWCRFEACRTEKSTTAADSAAARLRKLDKTSLTASADVAALLAQRPDVPVPPLPESLWSWIDACSGSNSSSTASVVAK